jgi:hypothetical protein
MFPSIRCTPIASFCVAALALASGAMPGARVGAAPAAQAEKFLGFEIGEQRRYVLGPPEALGPEESGIWAITLDAVYRTDGSAPEAVFLISHEWHISRAVLELPMRTITDVKSDGSVRANSHGFPLVIAYQTERHLAGLGQEAYTIDYQYEDGRYIKRTTMDGQWTQDVRLRSHEHLDRDLPAGLFAFLPAPPGCFDRPIMSFEEVARSTPPPQPRSAASPSATPPAPTLNKIVDNTDCEESLFANPGLLSLAMPALWEASGDREMLFFTPIGPIDERRVSGGVGVGIGQGTGGPPTRAGAGPPSQGGRRGGVLGPDAGAFAVTTGTWSTYHELERLSFGERVEVRLGSRSRDAWLFTGPAQLGNIYVDDDGVVLRIDLPVPEDQPQRWIRMLWPSEF